LSLASNCDLKLIICINFQQICAKSSGETTRNNAGFKELKLAKLGQILNSRSARQSKIILKARLKMTTTTLFATPYNAAATGFYFTDLNDYETKSNSLLDAYGNIVEEFSIELIDCDDSDLFLACNINQANLKVWFEQIEFLQDHEKVSLYYLLKSSYDLTQALEKLEEPMITQCELKDAAEELFDECYAHEISEALRYYFDMQKWARELEIGGDFVEFEYSSRTFTCTNANAM
jgi:hypothetical protein